MPKTRKVTPFGRQVRIRLTERNMTQLELCERIGCHPNYLTMILNGERSGEKYLDAILRELGLHYDDVFVQADLKGKVPTTLSDSRLPRQAIDTNETMRINEGYVMVDLDTYKNTT